MTITTSISGTMFSSALEQLTLATTSETATVVVSFAGTEIYNETLYADSSGQITLFDFASLVKPYVRQSLSGTLTVTATADDGTATATATLLYCDAVMNQTAAAFTASHFLNLLDGPKLTAPGRQEYLHYYGSGSPTVTATYDDGTTQTFTPTTSSSGGSYTTLDVSPQNYAATGKTLIAYTVSCGSRSQRYDIDPLRPDCAPMLLFRNSFGCEEIAYCTGTHTMSPDFQYAATFVEGRKENYEIEETRTFKADTGVMTHAMAVWMGDVFRSPEIRILMISPTGALTAGRYVIITSVKADVTNDSDALPRLTFEYTYAQRNHNVFDQTREGRVFDNTFDFTFN